MYGALHLVGARQLPFFGRAVGRLMKLFSGSRKRIARQNLSLALGPSLGRQSSSQILQRLMEELGLTLVELHPRYLQIESLRRRVAIQGMEHLNHALDQGRGAILATAHFGNFPLILARLGLEGYPVGVIVRDPRHRPVARFLDSWRERHRVRTVKDKPRWVSVKEALALLRQNGILVVHVDLNVSDGGMFVPFFGHWLPTFRGPAMLALRTKAPLLPTFIRRIHGLDHRLIIKAPLATALSGQREEDTWRVLLALNRELERAVLQHPDQWWWIHRRFRKARPAEEVGRSFPEGLL